MLDLNVASPERIERSVLRTLRSPEPLAARRPSPAPIEMLVAAGVRIPLERSIITPPIEAALRSGEYEADETRSLPEVVREGDRVLELGAGIGFVSSILARRTRAERVVAVEANPGLIPFIRRVHAINGVRGVEVVNGVACVGPAPQKGATASFYARPDFWMSSLSPEPYAYDAVHAVPMLSLVGLLRDNRITMVVCDIEGGEVALLPHADLSGVDRVYVEVHDHLTGLSGVKTLFDALSAKGFAYDLRHSCGSVVLFTRLGSVPDKRPYAG